MGVSERKHCFLAQGEREEERLDEDSPRAASPPDEVKRDRQRDVAPGRLPLSRRSRCLRGAFLLGGESLLLLQQLHVGGL